MRGLSKLLACIHLCLVGCAPDETHDSDANLIRTFHAQKATFAQLLSMIQTDQGLERVDEDWTFPDPPPITQERVGLYRELLKNIGCVRGFESFQNKSGIRFIASANGLATGGSSKSYYFHKGGSAPSPLVADLDSYRPGHDRTYAAYRHIEGNWYLVYEFDD